MRRTSVLFLCSTLFPSGACLVGCFTGSSGGATTDSGINFNNDSASPFEGGIDAPGSDAGLDVAIEGGFDVTIPESGPDGAPSVVVSNTPVDFGPADCGSTPATKTYSVQNSGPISVTWSAQASAPFTIQGTNSGTVAPGSTATITLGVSAIPTTSTAGVAITGTLTVTTDVPGFTTVQVPLSVTPQGGSLVLSPSPVAFGQQEIDTTSNPLAFSLTNVGNAAVTVAFGTLSDPEFALAGSGAIAPGAALAGTSATFTPTVNGTRTAVAAINVTGALCASQATSVGLSGTGSAAPVNIGPSPLDFKTVSCGTAGPPQAVTITNAGPAAITYLAALGKGDGGSPFAIDSHSGSIPVNGSVTVNVTPKVISVPANLAPDGYDDTLTITTTAAGAVPFTIPLKESASGAVLSVTMGNSNFGTVQNQTANLPFTVTNTGNVDAIVSVSTTGNGYGAVLTQGNVATANGGSVSGTASFAATSNGAAAGTLVVSTTTPQCNTPAQPVALSAVGAVPVVTSAPSVALSTTCGSLPGSQGTLTLQNTGNAPATLTVSSPSPFNSYFAIAAPPAPTTIAAGGTATITLQGTIPSNPIFANQAVGGQTVAGTLTFTTNEPSNPVHSVEVDNSINGANILVTEYGTATCDTPEAFTITNTGNMDATVFGPQFLDCTSPYQFSSDPFSSGGNLLSAGGEGSISGGFSANLVTMTCGYCPANSGTSGTDSITLTTDPSDNVCVLQTIEITYDSTNPSCSSCYQCGPGGGGC